MSAKAGTVLCCGILLLLFAVRAFAIEVRDDSGRLIRLAHPATRVITLAPNLTELAFDLGAGDKVVATVQFSNYPPAAKRLPRIGSSSSLNLEAILGYHPDLVLAWRSGNSPQQLRAIARLGIPVYRSEPQSLQDVATTLVRLGKLLGKQARAETLAQHMRAGIAQLQRQYAHRRSITGFYQIWNKPIYTVNGQHIISHIMRLCGVQNVFADAPVIAPRVSTEAVLARNPQMIISGGSARLRAQNLSSWQAWPQLAAVRAHNLFYIAPNLLQRDTPRILEGARLLCRQADVARMHLHLQEQKKEGQTH